MSQRVGRRWFPSLDYPIGRPLHRGLSDAANLRGESVALRFGDDALTFRELDGLSNAMASLLADRGVAPGHRVGMMCSNRPEFVIGLYGILKLGATILMLSPAWKEAELRHAFNISEPAHAIADGASASMLRGVLPPAAVTDFDDPPLFDQLSVKSGRKVADHQDWGPREAIVVFSSGTTGLPKAVRHTHASMGAGVVHWCSGLGLTAGDSFQVATPPFHILGLLNILSSVAAGASVRLHPRFDLERSLRCIERERLTLEMAVAPIALAIARYPSLESIDLSSLRYIFWGATPINEAVANEIQTRCGVPILAGYGASEVPVISVNPVRRPQQLWRVDTAGIPVHDVDVRVVAADFGTPLPDGAEGEIEVRGPSVMTGYEPASANVEAFHDGWYRTGDIGWVESEGWVHLTDRAKEMLKVRGFQVAPVEVEAVVQQHPDVDDCAVFGVDDAESGDAIVVAIKSRASADLDEQEVIEWVGDRLANYKRPRRVVFTDEIPRLPSGKVLRRDLKAQWSEILENARPFGG